MDWVSMMHQHVCVGVCERTRVTDRSFSVCLLCDSAVLSMTCKLHLSIDVGTTLQLSNQSVCQSRSIVNVCNIDQCAHGYEQIACDCIRKHQFQRLNLRTSTIREILMPISKMRDADLSMSMSAQSFIQLSKTMLCELIES